MDGFTSTNCNPQKCPFCIDGICTMECINNSIVQPIFDELAKEYNDDDDYPL